MRESFTERHDRERGARSAQMDRVAQGLSDLRAVDEKVLITPIDETEAEHDSLEEEQ
jgi:hypothetical protein